MLELGTRSRLLLTGEQRRLRQHFRTVLAELEAKDVGDLSRSRRRARVVNIERLRRYAQRAQFPKNRDFPRHAVPYFVDATGVHCAVGFLMAASGAHEAVARIRRTANHAKIFDLRADAALLAWLEASGLTLEEAARIQPSYCYTAASQCMCGSRAADAVYEVTAIMADDQYTWSVHVDVVHGRGTAAVGDVISAYPNVGVVADGRYLVRDWRLYSIDFPMLEGELVDTSHCSGLPFGDFPDTAPLQPTIDSLLGNCSQELGGEWFQAFGTTCGTAAATTSSGASTTGSNAASAGSSPSGEGGEGGASVVEPSGGCSTTASEAPAGAILLAAAWLGLTRRARRMRPDR